MTIRAWSYPLSALLGPAARSVRRNSPMPPFDDDGYSLLPYDEVVPGLFQADSSWLPPQLFALGFDAVFDLCGYDRSEGCEGLAYVFYPIDDVPWIQDPQAIHDLGRSVAVLVRSCERVVVNCMSGLNRSGLLVGRALIELGHTPREAVELVRAARGEHALSNREFARFLLVECRSAPDFILSDD